MTSTLHRSADLSTTALTELTAQLAGTAERHDRTAEFPWDGIRAVHEAGVLRLGIGARHGGQPIGVADTARVLQALGEGDPSVALLTAMTVLQHTMQDAAPWWPEDVYADVVARSTVEPVLINAVRAEPELGAPARGGLPATRVRRTATGWVLDGHKAYGTGSEGLAWHAVWAATDGSDTDGDPLVGHVLVPGDAPGIEIVRTWDHLGLRASSTHDIVYTGVEVPYEHFRGTPASHPTRDSAGLTLAGLAVPALYLGVARAAQAFFGRFAHERVPTSLGRPIASTERIQTVAGEIEARLVGAEEVLYGLAVRIDAGDRSAQSRVLTAKLLVTRAAIESVQLAVGTLGNPALSRHNPLERHLRDVQCARIHPPQDDAALLVAGRTALARTAAATTARTEPPATETSSTP